MVKLRAGERILRAGFAKPETGAAPERRQIAQRVGVEAEAAAHLAGARAAVAEMNRRAAVGVAGRDPCRSAHAPAAVLDLVPVGVDRAVLAAGAADFVADAELRRGLRAEPPGVAPGELGE